jgi:hypothetical protein
MVGRGVSALDAMRSFSSTRMGILRLSARQRHVQRVNADQLGDPEQRGSPMTLAVVCQFAS